MFSSRLIVVEPFEHFEILERWLPILATIHLEVVCWLRALAPEHQLADIAEAHSTVSLDFPDSMQDFDQWLKAKLSSLSPSDYVLWITTGLRYDRLQWIPDEIPLLIVGHNIQSLLAPQLVWPNRLRAIGTLAKYCLGRQAVFRRQLLSRCPILLVPDTMLAKKASTLGYDQTRIQVWRFCDEITTEDHQEKTTRCIVVPGTVRPGDRDYDALFQLINQSIASWEVETTLIFLGHCKSRPFRIKWEQLAAGFPNFQVQFFDQPVPSGEYASTMLRASVLILPLRRKVCFGPFREYMGHSKVSGGIYDAFAYNKAVLLPDFYSTDDLKGQLAVYHYSSAADAAEKLVQLLKGPSDTARPEGRAQKVREQMYNTFSTILRE